MSREDAKAELSDEAGTDWYNGQPDKLVADVRKFEDNLSYGRFLDGVINRLYFGEGIMPTGQNAPTTGVPNPAALLRSLDSITQENLIKSVLDTAASMIVRKPAYKVVTTGGSWSKQIAARRMSRLLTGLYSAAGLENEITAIFLDSCRCQVAASKWVFDVDGKLRCERVLPHTLIWNPAEGPNPRNLFQRHAVPRAKVIAEAKKRKGNLGGPLTAQEAEKLPRYRPDVAFYLDTEPTAYAFDRDMVEVIEGWRLPGDGEDGRYVKICGDVVLVDEKWTIPVFPIVVLTFGDSYQTFAGDPLGRQILPFQLTVNRMNRAIDEHQVKCIAAKVMIPKGSEVIGWNNTIGELIYYNAAAGEPKIVPGQALPPEFYRYKDSVKAAAHELAGVSYSIASGTKEAGLNSGRAQRDRYDIANSRLVLHAQRVERWLAENGRVAMAMMRWKYGAEGNEGKKARLLAPNTKLLEEIDWSQIGDIKEDEIAVRCYITSAIPVTPAGMEEALSERVQAGVMSPKRAQRWFSNPDEARLEDEDSAVEDLVMKIVDSALIDGEYIAPEPIMGGEGLGMLLDRAGVELMKALSMKDPPPPTNVELLRRLIEQTKQLLGPKPVPAPTAAPAPPAPMGGPAPIPGAPPPAAMPPPVAAAA
jgi:hypothetical protein